MVEIVDLLATSTQRWPHRGTNQRAAAQIGESKVPNERRRETIRVLKFDQLSKTMVINDAVSN